MTGPDAERLHSAGTGPDIVAVPCRGQLVEDLEALGTARSEDVHIEGNGATTTIIPAEADTVGAWELAILGDDVGGIEIDVLDHHLGLRLVPPSELVSVDLTAVREHLSVGHCRHPRTSGSGVGTKPRRPARRRPLSSS